MDPKFLIRIKMKRIRNTGIYCHLLVIAHLCLVRKEQIVHIKPEQKKSRLEMTGALYTPPPQIPIQALKKIQIIFKDKDLFKNLFKNFIVKSRKYRQPKK